MSDAQAPHEAGRLHLQVDKAHHQLGWRPRWPFATTVARTVASSAVHEGANPHDCCLADLGAYGASGRCQCVELSRHAIDKLQIYGIEGHRLQGWQTALAVGEPFLDISSGASELVILWEGRPWVVILSNNGKRVVKTDPTDERTVANRRGGGRWIVANN